MTVGKMYFLHQNFPPIDIGVCLWHKEVAAFEKMVLSVPEWLTRHSRLQCVAYTLRDTCEYSTNLPIDLIIPCVVLICLGH